MYSKAAEDEDDNMIMRSQKEADGVLIFVSSRIKNKRYLCVTQKYHRPVYSLLRSLCSFP